MSGQVGSRRRGSGNLRPGPFDSGTSIVAESGVAVRLVEGAMLDLEPGRRAEPARTIDVAPTLARLAGIPIPEGLDRRPLLR